MCFLLCFFSSLFVIFLSFDFCLFPRWRLFNNVLVGIAATANACKISTAVNLSIVCDSGYIQAFFFSFVAKIKKTWIDFFSSIIHFALLLYLNQIVDV